MDWILDIAQHSNPSRSYQERIIENIARLAWQPVETKPSTWENISRQACEWARETSWMTWITVSVIAFITGCLVRSRRKIQQLQIVINNSNNRINEVEGVRKAEEANQRTQAAVQPTGSEASSLTELVNKIAEKLAARETGHDRKEVAPLFVNNYQMPAPQLYARRMDINEWLAKMEIFMRTNQIRHNRREILWAHLDDKCAKIMEGINLSEDEDTAFEQLKTKLREVFGEGQPQPLDRINKFTERDQRPEEGARMYAVILSNLAAKAFGKDNKYLDQLIKERFVKGLVSREIRMKLIADPPLNSSHMVETAAELEDALRREQSRAQTSTNPYGNIRYAPTHHQQQQATTRYPQNTQNAYQTRNPEMHRYNNNNTINTNHQH